MPASPVRTRHVVDRHGPDLAVADGAGAGRLDDALDETGRVGVVDQDLDLDLRHELDRVLGAAVHLGVAALAAEALHGRRREPVHTERLHRGLHVVELERLDDCHHEFHSRIPSVGFGANGR